MEVPGEEVTSRFSDRVSDYARFRPGYPSQVCDVIAEVTGLPRGAEFADIGAGTGLFSQLLLNAGYRVVAVEPNQPMRRVAEEAFSSNPLYRSVDGRAEATGLPERSVDAVAVAQALHWFDVPACRSEFARILRPPAWLAVVWNTRIDVGDPFSEGYEQLLQQHGTDYRDVRHANRSEESIRLLLGDAPVFRAVDSWQQFDWEGLQGRLMSTSYVPSRSDPRSERMLVDLRQLFDRCEQAGQVTMRYATQIWLGPLVSR
jgi:SAM-dependent methyltransferase